MKNEAGLRFNTVVFCKGMDARYVSALFICRFKPEEIGVH